MKSYLMALELNNHGFIIGITDKILHAKKVLNKLIKFAELYAPEELETKFISHLQEYRRYKINGNNLLIEKYKFGTAYGPLSSSIIVIDTKTFSPELFIKERENSSHVFYNTGLQSSVFKKRFIQIIAN